MRGFDVIGFVLVFGNGVIAGVAGAILVIHWMGLI